MTKRTRRSGVSALFLVLSLVLGQALWAAPAATGPAAHKTLANGLEVFVVDNNSVPLVTVCVAFRGGASAQVPENAGLFHLYEHMLFTGNEKYPSQAAFTAALNKMGVASWNGGTGSEYINYYITVPSDRAAEGVEFWSWAVKKPRFDAATLENEKGVVINEIRGYHTDPDQIMENAFESRLYRDYPWRKNIDGPEANIKGATPEALEAMRKAYYIPKNTALLVGGDIRPEAAFALAEKFFGDWTGGPAPVVGEPAHGPFPKDVRIAYADEDFYDGIAQVQYRWRGPDVLRQTKDTYVADVLLFLVSSPVGKFKQSIMEKVPGLYDAEYVSFNYPTARDGGAFQFSTYMLLEDPEGDPTLPRVEKMREALLEEFGEIARDPEAYFGAAELAKAKTKLVDQNLLSMEVAGDFMTGTLTFWWSVATTDYFFGYEENCAKVSFADISDLIRRYLLDKPVGTALRYQSGLAEAEPGLEASMEELGYEAVDPEAAFWWQR